MEDVMRGVERTAAVLLSKAHNITADSADWRQSDLLAAARAYANAMRSLHNAARRKTTP